jgi:hypothetical protein
VAFFYPFFAGIASFEQPSSTSTRWSRGLWIINSFVHKWDVGVLDVFTGADGFLYGDLRVCLGGAMWSQ